MRSTIRLNILSDSFERSIIFSWSDVQKIETIPYKCYFSQCYLEKAKIKRISTKDMAVTAKEKNIATKLIKTFLGPGFPFPATN